MKRRKAWTGILLIFAVGAGLVVFQRQYISKHLPLLRAELAAAEAEGSMIFEKLGTPPDSEPYAAGEKTYNTGGRKSMWRGENTSIMWEQPFEVPGDFERITAWYREGMFADGWESFDDASPGKLVREIKRGKWIVTLSNLAVFDHPQRTRVGFQLCWGYWHHVD